MKMSSKTNKYSLERKTMRNIIIKKIKMVFRGTKLVLTHIHAAKLGEKKKQLQQI